MDGRRLSFYKSMDKRIISITSNQNSFKASDRLCKVVELKLEKLYSNLIRWLETYFSKEICQ